MVMTRYFLRVSDTDAVRDEAIGFAREFKCGLAILNGTRSEGGSPLYDYVFIGEENAVYAVLSSCGLDESDLADGTAEIGVVL